RAAVRTVARRSRGRRSRRGTRRARRDCTARGRRLMAGKDALRLRLDAGEELQLLCRTRGEHAIEVREPLVPGSQIQRSGGTLLSQLFDGHPECHAHPHELTIGYPKSQIWPQLDLAAPDAWYELLYEKYAQKHLRRGYGKPAERSKDADPDVFPF